MWRKRCQNCADSDYPHFGNKFSKKKSRNWLIFRKTHEKYSHILVWIWFIIVPLRTIWPIWSVSLQWPIITWTVSVALKFSPFLMLFFFKKIKKKSELKREARFTLFDKKKMSNSVENLLIWWKSSGSHSKKMAIYRFWLKSPCPRQQCVCVCSVTLFLNSSFWIFEIPNHLKLSAFSC